MSLNYSSPKHKIRYTLARLGIWQPADTIRKLPNILNWLNSGCTKYAPHPVKMKVVKSYLKKFALGQFVETGTYLGETLDYISKENVFCTSIELSEDLYEMACQRFKKYKNVKLIQGDSGQRIPELMSEVSHPTLFWLDGHYSEGITAGSDVDTPISTELQTILDHSIKSHVILIDDARCFDGTDNYPHLDELMRKVRENGNYLVEVSTDIIRITPKVAFS